MAVHAQQQGDAQAELELVDRFAQRGLGYREATRSTAVIILLY